MMDYIEYLWLQAKQRIAKDCDESYIQCSLIGWDSEEEENILNFYSAFIVWC